MTTIQYKIFVWVYTLLDTMIGGAATATAIALASVQSGGVVELHELGRNALLAALAHAVYYLRKSPLPELLKIKKEAPTDAE